VKLGIYRALSMTWFWLRKTVIEKLAMTWFPFGNLTMIGLIWLYELKQVKDEQMWSIAPLSIIQELKEERNLVPVCVVVWEGMTEIWLETLSLDLDCRLTMFDIAQE